MARRPEHTGPPELFYNEFESKKYSQNSRVIEVQRQMSERALELLMLPENTSCYILDVGCGSGICGEVLTESGHQWAGIDISDHMLKVAQERNVEGDLFLWDMGEGLGFRSGTFDGVISISALQWLCNADRSDHHPPKRLYTFFSSLYACMTRGARAVIQLYPENPNQMDLITQQAMKAGFTGGVLVDYPNSSKAKKIFLCLFTGASPAVLPKALGTTEEQVTFTDTRRVEKRRRGKNEYKSRDWIVEKKARWQAQGRDVRPESKYTGRKRKHRI